VGKNTSEILEAHGVPLTSINSVIWSHYHWDHTGDVSLFPTTASLIVGPDFHTKLPGYPTNPKSPINESDFAHRELVSLTFPKKGTHIGSFPAHDFFGDGSFYLLDR
jgi:metal-dependent hydrolase (beta-lactamase superfamily II)